MGEVIPILGPGSRSRPPPKLETPLEHLERTQRDFQRAWAAFLNTNPPPSRRWVREIYNHHFAVMDGLRDLLSSRFDGQLELAGLRQDGGTCDND